MWLVDDYGYEDLTGDPSKIDVEVNGASESVEPGVTWTDFVVSFWLIVGAIIILNLFIGDYHYQ